MYNVSLASGRVMRGDAVRFGWLVGGKLLSVSGDGRDVRYVWDIGKDVKYGRGDGRGY